MNTIQTTDTETSMPNLQDERTKLLNILASKTVATLAEKNLMHENAELAKYTGLNPETDVKQPRNEPETEAKYSNSDPANEENVNLDELPLPLQIQILEIIDANTLDAATLQVTTKKPYGLGIKTNRTALYRFHKNHEAAKLAAHRDDAARQAAQLLKNADATDAEFSRATQHLIKLRLLEASMCDKTNPNAILALTKSLDRLRASDHAERRLVLAEKKTNRQPASNTAQTK